MPKRSKHISPDALHYKNILGQAVGSRIRERRIQLGFSQDEVRQRMVLEQVYVTRTQYSRIERGEILPHACEIIGLIRVLDISADHILFGE